MAQPTIEHVYQAIDALYHSQKTEDKEPASKWLDNFQRSVHAWEISDQLLRRNRDPESTYFAAQSMKTKIQSHFNELPIAQHLALRDSLIEHLLQYSLASHATLTQLCLALADLAIQCTQWENPVNDLVKKFSTKLEHFSILLEILMIMPEEDLNTVGDETRHMTLSAFTFVQLESDYLHIGANRRNEVYENFQQCSGVVFDLMLKCHDVCPADDRTQCRIYQCFGSWLTIGSFPSKEVAESKLLRLAFETLETAKLSVKHVETCLFKAATCCLAKNPSMLGTNTSDNLHDAVTDCLCNALYTAGDMTNQMPLAEACFQFVSSMLPPAYEKSVKEEEMDKSINYARIFSEMGEAFLEPILTMPGQGPGNLKTIDLVLSCSSHPNYEVAEISFNFWYRFVDNLSANCPGQEDMFKPYIQQLIMNICQVCQFEDSYQGVPGKGDEFQEFRLRALDVIHEVVFIVGSPQCFAQIFQSLQGPTPSWNKLESRLFAMNPMTKFLSRDDPTPGYVIQMILNLPQLHVMVNHTCIVLLGDLTFWMVDHEQVHNPVFQYILDRLQNKDLALMSAFALSKYCNHLHSKMNKMFPILLEVSKAVDSLPIDNEGVISILSGCAMVLSKMPKEVVTDGLMHLCTPHVQPLYEIVKSTGAHDPVKYLDRLACIFRNVQVSSVEHQEHPCKKVIEQLWDLFKMITEKYKADERIIERHFRCIRFGIRCLGQDFMHLLQPLVELMMGLYSQHPHSCLLYIGSILVDEYGTNKKVEPTLLVMLKQFIDPTFKMLSSENGLFHHPDTVDDFFRLCIRFLQQCTLSFLKMESTDSVVQLAIAGISLHHREANQSVMKFFVELIKCTFIDQSKAEYNEARERITLVEGLLGKYGSDIVKGLVNACAGGLQAYMLPDLADVLWEMLQFCQRPTCQWFKEALSTLPSHNSSGVINATPSQIEQFYNTITGATSIKVLWKEFREFSRYFK